MITSSLPKVETTSMYGVMETCNILGISRNTLSKYSQLSVKEGGIVPRYRPATKKKVYTGAEILRFWKTQM